MISKQSANSKFEETHHSNSTVLNSIISKKPSIAVNRIVEIKLNKSAKLDYTEEVFTYEDFKVSENGYYNINNQCQRKYVIRL